MRLFETFTLVCGPCVLEDDAVNLQVARKLADISERHSIPVVFKGSFDKANRSQLSSARGLGPTRGIRALAKVRQETGLPLCTDIHEPWHARRVGDVVDVIQIPAFLCRQTDLLLAAGKIGTCVNIKKGQWMAPEEMQGAVEKAWAGGAEQVVVTERGTMFGYGDLVVDMRSFRRTGKATEAPVLFDGTHSVQRPGLANGSSGGNPEHTPALVRAAVAAGCDGLFLEAHPDPRNAPSDSTNMLSLETLSSLMHEVMLIRQALGVASWKRV